MKVKSLFHFTFKDQVDEPTKMFISLNVKIVTHLINGNEKSLQETWQTF